ncbi:zinc finger BED domain-containing protein RICESLEEPER 3-like [Apium graveolens]|uniref:zinc finger BED domain-containing protein RICESLEEPER 3-like n=1 Tax=Apium graveolens TaxID=4045 RepID=UPI003D7B56B2
MAKRMKAKYDKYWDNIDNINFLFYVAVLLDPRRKMQYIDYCFSQIYPNEREKQIIMKEKVKSTLDAFYKDYVRLEEAKAGGGTTKKHFMMNSNITRMSIDEEEDEEDDVDLIVNFEKHLESEDSMTSKSEIDVYMLDAIERNLGDHFDILQWWKMNSVKFPILSKIAKNVLGMPISTVASESAFSTGGRVIDPFRSSLTPKTAKALICTQDWIKSKNSKQTDLDTPHHFSFDGIRKQLEEIEKYELGRAPKYLEESLIED